MLEKKLVLPDGKEIPQIGLGTWQTPADIAQRVVNDAISVGYRHIDTAVVYENEEGVGKGIIDSKIAREDIFVTSKVPAETKNYEEAKKVIDESLQRLQLDYLDLMLIHAPRPWSEMGSTEGNDYKKENLEVWKALEEAQEAGKIKSIGVSNFEISDLKNILENGKVKPQVNQIRVHIGHNQAELVKFCQENNILVEAYSPIATGRLLDHPTVKNMAEKYGATIPQLCIRYVMQLGTVALPKSTHKEYMEQNAKLDFVISEEDMTALKNVEEIG